MSNERCEFESRAWRGVLDTTLCDKVCQWLATGRWFSPCTPVSSTNKTDHHDIAEILLKVALNTIIPYPNPNGVHLISFNYKFISNVIIDQLFKFYVNVNITSVHSCVSGINDLRPMSILWRIEFSLSFDKYSISWSPCENMSLYIFVWGVSQKNNKFT